MIRFFLEPLGVNLFCLGLSLGFAGMGKFVEWRDPYTR
jgi:hypothetical protein